MRRRNMVTLPKQAIVKADYAGATVTFVPAKGCCKKCGKHIGRGLHFHTKACRGTNDK
jgi:hypothetical protein